MKYLDEYRDAALARKVVQEITRLLSRAWTIMEICGGQTHAIVKHGIDYLLPPGSRVGTRSWLPGLRHPFRDDR